MELISNKSWGSPLQVIYDSILTSNQKEQFKQSLIPKTYLYYMGTYKRMLPSAREKYNYYIWDRIPDSIQAELKSGTANIILDTSIESLFLPGHDSSLDLAEIHKAIHELGISPKCVILAHSNLAAPKQYDEINSKLGIVEPFKLWTLDFAMMYTSLILEKDSAIKERIGLDFSQVMSQHESLANLIPFLYLNRKIKLHRAVILLAAIECLGENKILFSLLGGNERNKTALKGTLNNAAKILSSLNISNLGIDTDSIIVDLISRFPITLPGEATFGDAKTDAIRSIDASLYDGSFMSIVGETLFSDGSNLFITEKVMKPLFWSHPFLVVGDPGTLARLKELGFRTFSKVINEEYDEKLDPLDRFRALIMEICRIGSLSDEELRLAKLSLAEDVQYNLDYLCNGFRDAFAKLFMESFLKVIN